MSIATSLFVVLLALDGPLGQGVPPLVARFGSDECEAIPAVFARHPAESMPGIEIVWFLDADALGVPVGKSEFLCSGTLEDNPVLTPGTFPLSLPLSKKTEIYRGIIRQTKDNKQSTPLGTVRLAVFPPSIFSEQWETLAKEGISLALAGPLAGLREFLEERDIRFAEADLNDPGTIDRNGMLVVDAEEGSNFFVTPGQARTTLVFGASDLSWQSGFRMHQDEDTFLWIQRPMSPDFAHNPLAQSQFLNLATTLASKKP